MDIDSGYIVGSIPASNSRGLKPRIGDWLSWLCVCVCVLVFPLDQCRDSTSNLVMTASLHILLLLLLLLLLLFSYHPNNPHHIHSNI
jgi:hypothetical protein